MTRNSANKPGYKHTPLGWIPEEWEIKRLEEIAIVNPTRKNLDDHAEVSFLAMADVSEEGKIVNQTVKRYFDVKNGFTYFENGDVLIAKITPCFENGKGAMAQNLKNGVGFGSTEFHVVRASKAVLPDIIFFASRMHGFRGRGTQNMTGSAGQQRVPTDFVATYRIPLPPLPEQRAIANVLGTWDRAIETLQKLVAQKELRKKWLMQVLLTGKKRLKGFSGEWRKHNLYDIASELSIRNVANKQLTVLSCTKYNGLVPSLEYFGRKIFSNNLSTYKIVQRNTYAYATNHIEEGSIGLQRIFDEALISPMYTVFRTNGTLDNEFLFAVLKSHPLVHQYQKRMEGSINRRGGLRWDEFSKIRIRIPDMREQTAIASVLQIADRENRLLNQKLEQLKTQKKGLMQKLLTGEIRVRGDYNANT